MATSQKKLLLERFKKFLKTKVYCVANQLDTDTNQMKLIFDEFKKSGYFKIYLPKEYGGYNLSQAEKLDLYEAIGRWGAAFGFLQIQSVMAIWFLQQSSNISLKSNYFQKLKNNEVTIGNTLSYMKPGSKTIPIATETNDGYMVSGTIMFASGWKLFDKLLIGFEIENHKEEAFTIIPFKNINSNKGNIKIGCLLKTIVMQSTNTVSIDIKNYFVPKHQVINKWPKGIYYKKYCSFPPSTFMLGIAKTALDVVKKLSCFSTRQEIHNGYFLLNKKLEKCSRNTRNLSTKIKIGNQFAEIITLSWNCVQFAMLASGGASLSIHHEAQRLYREIVIWAVQKTFPTVMKSWLKNIN